MSLSSMSTGNTKPASRPDPSSSRLFTRKKRSARFNKRNTNQTTNANEVPKCKTTFLSSLFSLTFSSNAPAKNAPRGLGCTSAPDVHNPSSESKKLSRNPAKASARATGMNKNKQKKIEVVDSDVCCAPGIPFSTSADSVDSVVSRRPADSVAAKLNPQHQRNGAFDFTFDVDSMAGEWPYIGRLSTMLEHMSDMHSTPSLGTSPMNYRHLNGLHRSSGDLRELVMLQTALFFGGIDLCDQHSDWRLDVDNMTYEELLELGDNIGHVSTGLNEEQIAHCLKKTKRTCTLASHFPCERERTCIICQEEYEGKDELGKLECDHNFHMCCIRQWLSRKNACPVCKAAAFRC